MVGFAGWTRAPHADALKPTDLGALVIRFSLRSADLGTRFVDAIRSANEKAYHLRIRQMVGDNKE